jgi:hypothetical protein
MMMAARDGYPIYTFTGLPVPARVMARTIYDFFEESDPYRDSFHQGNHHLSEERSLHGTQHPLRRVVPPTTGVSHMLNTIPRAKLHGLAHLDPLANYRGKLKPKRLMWIVLFSALLVSVPLAAQNQIRYSVTELGTLGGTFSQAFVINNNGSIAGFASLPGDTVFHPFLWRSGVMTKPRQPWRAVQPGVERERP